MDRHGELRLPIILFVLIRMDSRLTVVVDRCNEVREPLILQVQRETIDRMSLLSVLLQF